jgi:hypothetical protein
MTRSEKSESTKRGKRNRMAIPEADEDEMDRSVNMKIKSSDLNLSHICGICFCLWVGLAQVRSLNLQEWLDHEMNAA